ncbi:MAG: GNAT family protein [Acidobacteriota bacterium]
MDLRDFAGKRFRVDDDIELRHWTELDAEVVYELVKRNYEHLRTFMEWVKPDHSLVDYEKFVEREIRGTAENERLGFGIYRGDGLIGTIGLINFDHDAKVTEIGYWIDAAEEGKGIVSKACRKLIDFVFGELAMNRIQIRCAAPNFRSGAIPERFGFTREGTQRQHVLRDGKLMDFVTYGLLASEWNQIDE